jgi:hypothetical protein
MDIGRTPLNAMDQISQPLLQAMRLKVDSNIQPILEDNMAKKYVNNKEIAAKSE